MIPIMLIKINFFIFHLKSVFIREGQTYFEFPIKVTYFVKKILNLNLC